MNSKGQDAISHLQEYADSVEIKAKRRRDLIISREGDDNGARLSPEYLEDLKDEIRKSDMMEGATEELYYLCKYGYDPRDNIISGGFPAC